MPLGYRKASAALFLYASPHTTPSTKVVSVPLELFPLHPWHQVLPLYKIDFQRALSMLVLSLQSHFSKVPDVHCHLFRVSEWVHLCAHPSSCFFCHLNVSSFTCSTYPLRHRVYLFFFAKPFWGQKKALDPLEQESYRWLWAALCGCWQLNLGLPEVQSHFDCLSSPTMWLVTLCLWISFLDFQATPFS